MPMYLIIWIIATFFPPSYVLHSAGTTLTVSSAGGRIVSLQLKGHELLLSQEKERQYFGATVWPDPQSHWWPPDTVLDVSPYQTVYAGADSLSLLSRVGAHGLQIEKQVAACPGDSSFSLTYIFHNRSARDTLDAGIWELARVPGRGSAFFPARDTSLQRQPALPSSDLGGVSQTDGLCWYTALPYAGGAGHKLFADASGGWLAWVAHGLLFIRIFPVVSSREIAAGQRPVEIYTNGVYSELELHGRFRRLLPGHAESLRVRWYVRSLPAPLADGTNRAGLATFVRHFVTQHRIR